MTRLKAFSIHLIISAAAISLIVALFIWQWFPLPFFLTSGGWEGLRLLAVVSCVIGPLITLIIYNPSELPRVYTRGILKAKLRLPSVFRTLTESRWPRQVPEDSGYFHPRAHARGITSEE